MANPIRNVRVSTHSSLWYILPWTRRPPPLASPPDQSRRAPPRRAPQMQCKTCLPDMEGNFVKASFHIIWSYHHSSRFDYAPPMFKICALDGDESSRLELISFYQNYRMMTFISKVIESEDCGTCIFSSKIIGIRLIYETSTRHV